jgi:hypothetical protein
VASGAFHEQAPAVAIEDVTWPVVVEITLEAGIHQISGTDAFTHTVIAARRYHFRYDACYGVLGLAGLTVGEQDYARAATLVGFVDTELDRWGHVWPEPERSYRDQAFADSNQNLAREPRR